MLERKTTISSEVIQHIDDSKSPLSVAQIMAHLQEKGLQPNKTTIYRILQKMMESKDISEVTLKNGTSYYERPKSHHHHHFICKSCGELYCLDACHVESLHIDLSKLLPNKNFRIQSHDFNLYGICERCNN